MRTTHPTPTLANKTALLLGLVLGVLACAAAWGQESRQESQKYYNLKAGPVLVTLSSGMSVQYNDNINLSSGRLAPIQSDIILNPHFGISAISELQILPKSQTDVTTLGFTLNLGTTRYLQHPELNTQAFDLTIAPDSELSFLIRTGHFRTRLFDRFSLQENPASDGTLSNVAKFRRFTNTTGFNTTWDMNSKTAFSFGYEHTNLFALSYTTLSGTAPRNLQSLDNSTDQISLSGASQIFSLLKVGAGASATSTNFPDNPEQNTTSYSYGPFLDARLTQYTTLHASYSIAGSRNGGMFDGNGNDTSNGSLSDATNNNFNLSLTNRMNRYYTHTFAVGRQNQFNVLGELTVTNSLTYYSTWNVNSRVSLNSSLFTEDTTNLSNANSNPYYKRYGCTLGTGYRLSRKLLTTLSYQYSNKISDDPDQSYKQNTIMFNISYAF